MTIFVVCDRLRGVSVVQTVWIQIRSVYFYSVGYNLVVFGDLFAVCCSFAFCFAIGVILRVGFVIWNFFPLIRGSVFVAIWL